MTPVPASPRLCVDGCVHMLHSVTLRPVPGPVLNLAAHGLNVQMVQCKLLCSLDATLSSRATQGHRFQLSSPTLHTPSPLLVIEFQPVSMSLFLPRWSVLSTVEERQLEAIKLRINSRDCCEGAYTVILLPHSHGCSGMH